jgi:signal peptidase I
VNGKSVGACSRWRWSWVGIAVLLGASAAGATDAPPMRAWRAASTAMEPTVLLREAVLVDTEYYRTHQPARGDVVVLRSPRDNQTEQLDRIVGLPSDRIQMRGGQLFINDRQVPRHKIEDYEYHFETGLPAEMLSQYVETLPPGISGEDRAHRIIKKDDDRFLDNTKVFEVPATHYFVLGDNRDNSVDSRTDVGFVPAANIIGRAIRHAGAEIE